jgi:hypothetical protein
VGIVLSDRTGNLQAFYHDGDISKADLDKWVTRFADPSVGVRSTMTNDSLQVSMYPPSDSSSTSNTLGGYAPTGYGYPGYQGSFGGGYAPSFGGGCPGGNCGGGGFRRR